MNSAILGELMDDFAAACPIDDYSFGQAATTAAQTTSPNTPDESHGDLFSADVKVLEDK